MARQLGCGQMPPRLFLHEFLKLERKSNNSCTVAESSIMCAVPLPTPGLLYPQQ
jgi:hypothetical protein